MTSSVPQKARAAVIAAFDRDLVLKDNQPVLQPSQLAPGECLVKIDYAGVCHSDLHIKEGGWGPVKFPRVGGHEGIGHIVAIGEHTVSSPVAIGDRVGIKWIAKACLNCEMCRTGNESCCSTGTISHGYKVDGSFADYALSYVDYVTPIPEKLDSAATTPLLCAGLTIYKALKEANLKVGNWIAIPGAGGGLGHLGIQYAIAMGLRVIAIDTGDAKRDLCLKLGAEKWIDFKTSTNLIQDVKEAADGKGPHAAVVVSSNAGPLDQAVMYLRPKGTLVAVGIPSGAAMFTVPIGLLIAKCLTIVGSALGNRQDMAEALDIAASGKIACHYEVRPFSEVNAVFADLAAQKISGRVVLKM
ncbi:Mannitol-1-phosphate dehydrogenase [Mycena venus]|uniref:alcohol dehydrogenase n=1 Tax=Mycena venus TaxID=2733690 RepID=A0A8H7CXI0_9AGAR|nr:Mannitol-1-phosphate dehydrogenase [Mycena venus]